jgi:LysM repeat protein
MKFSAAAILTFSLLCSGLNGRAQSIQVDIEEFKRLQGEVADMRDARVADARKISDLTRKVEQLQSALRDSNEKSTLRMGDYITREDLKKIVDRIAEVDSQRENDRKVILEEFDKLAKALSRPPMDRSKGRDREVTERNDPPAKEEKIEGEFYPHTVKSGETLGEILQAYNAALKKDGRPTVTFSQVKKVNPKLNLNRIRVGEEILLPVPAKK